jgi:hypothetical protein
MAFLKRLSFMLGMILAVALVVLSVVGIIGLWAANAPITNLTVGAATSMAGLMDRANATAATAGTSLSPIAQQVQDVETQLATAAETGVASPELNAEAQRLLDEVSPQIQEVTTSVRAVYDTLGAASEFIDSLNSIPFLGLDVPGETQLAAAQQLMVDVVTTAQNFFTELRETKQEIVSAVATRLGARIAPLSDALDRAVTDLAALEDRTGAASERLTATANSLPGWIDAVWIVLTLTIVWFIYSQIVLFNHLRAKWRAAKDVPASA